MKLIIAIVNHDDASAVTQNLSKKGFTSTRLSSAGGFLLAKRFADVTIGEKTRSALVAFAAEGLGKGEIYQALTGG